MQPGGVLLCIRKHCPVCCHIFCLSSHQASNGKQYHPQSLHFLSQRVHTAQFTQSHAFLNIIHCVRYMYIPYLAFHMIRFTWFHPKRQTTMHQLPVHCTKSIVYVYVSCSIKPMYKENSTFSLTHIEFITCYRIMSTNKL